MWSDILLVSLAFFQVGDAFGSLPHGNNAAKPFTLRVADSQIKEFKTLLTTSKIGPESWYTTNGDGQFGTTRDWLVEAKKAWLKHDWRKQEKRINSFPNFKAIVDDETVGATPIHFTGLFSKKKDAIPLLFLHGWPGSFLEFLPLLDLLKSKYTAETLPYHIVVPSLPHYGLSGGPQNAELTMLDGARLMDQLMVKIGFGTGYVVQGGDIGSSMARILSVISPSVKAFHVNMLTPASLEEFLTTVNVTQTEQEHLERMSNTGETGMSYFLEHSYRPGTVGLMLSTNPLAMLTWIGEKLVAWPDKRYPLSLDSMLTLVSFYWYTDTMPRALYPYRAIVGTDSTGTMFDIPTSKEKPFGYSVFPSEYVLLPESWAHVIYPNLVYYRRNEKGGHFAALEQPALFLENIEEFLQVARPAIGI
ncbi:epoxide hydrolase [Plectosphaerella plurivora]|uniref:Epoxide hydrolase n=1 Tax=Plectosphaerella plurivora TaxID=936078 RepID=A0A9P8V862_9PEZI|nr:epoxide hydrolase [Plectosphaerella plurivora]